MTIDDPIDAVRRQFDNEERSSDPVLRHMLDLASKLPLPWLADKAVNIVIGSVQADRLEKMNLLIDSIVDELRRLEARLNDETRFKEWLPLVVDGFKKAEQTRAKKRVERIGVILANSLMALSSPSADDVEEMMRVAMALSDSEIQALNELIRVQGQIVNKQGRIDRNNAWFTWTTGPWGARPDGGIDSIFAKLESFGLVTTVPPQNTQNIYADVQNR